jgi:hypothetical protein
MYQVNEYVEQCLDLKGEICKLRVLLRDCGLLLRKQTANDEVEHKESAELILKIDEVL